MNNKWEGKLDEVEGRRDNFPVCSVNDFGAFYMGMLLELAIFEVNSEGDVSFFMKKKYFLKYLG